jgi:hypothetical protein
MVGIEDGDWHDQPFLAKKDKGRDSAGVGGFGKNHPCARGFRTVANVGDEIERHRVRINESREQQAAPVDVGLAMQEN